MNDATSYTIETQRPGTWSLNTTKTRANVRGFVLTMAARAGTTEGAILLVRSGRMYANGPILSKYVVSSGRWVRAYGTEVRGLEGLDAAGCYMAHYQLPHVTREYAEQQVA